MRTSQSCFPQKCSMRPALCAVLLGFSVCSGFLFPPQENAEAAGPDMTPSDSTASYVNSSEFLAKWLEDPKNREIVEPITDCYTYTIDPSMMTNSPDSYYASKYNTNTTYTTIHYDNIQYQIRLRLETFFQPPDMVNFTFVKALFIPLTQPKLMYRTLIVSDKFLNVPMFERQNLTSSVITDELRKHAAGYKHEQHLFVFTHDEWRRKKDAFMEEHSTLFYHIPLTAERVTFGPYGKKKRDVGGRKRAVGKREVRRRHPEKRERRHIFSNEWENWSPTEVPWKVMKRGIDPWKGAHTTRARGQVCDANGDCKGQGYQGGGHHWSFWETEEPEK